MLYWLFAASLGGGLNSWYLAIEAGWPRLPTGDEHDEQEIENL